MSASDKASRVPCSNLPPTGSDQTDISVSIAMYNVQIISNTNNVLPENEIIVS